MKLAEVTNPKVEPPVEPETPMLLKKQAGPKLSKREEAEIKRRVRHGHVPSLLKKQAE